MSAVLSWLLVALVVLPAVSGLGRVLVGRRSGGGVGRVGAAVTAVAFAVAVVVVVFVVAVGPVSAVLVDSGGRAVGGLFADRLAGVMLLLVLGVSAVVQLYSSRYLSGDPAQARLIAAAGMTTTGVAGMVTAATLSVLVVCWLVTGAGLLAMLGQRRDLGAARLGVRRAAAAFAVGDVALVMAAAVAWITVGELDLRQVEAAAAALAGQRWSVFGVSVSAGAVVACLLVVAAMGRSAQWPLQRWLPATLAAPTPVSAFLHAGLVNAGGFLLVRLGPIFGLTPAATYLAFAVGVTTALYGTVVMLTKPDIKGGLAHSTMGQMGFMMMACSLGAPAAAIFHLVSHGMYKATLFLGADAVVHHDKRRAVVPTPAPGGTGWGRSRQLVVAAVVPAAALTVALATFAGPALVDPGAVVLVVFAWATAAHAGWSWLATTPGRVPLGLAVLALCCLVYAGLIAGAHQFLTPAIHPPGQVVPAGLMVVPVAAVLVGLLTARQLPRWRHAAYVRALDAGHVSTARPNDSPRLIRRPSLQPTPQDL